MTSSTAFQAAHGSKLLNFDDLNVEHQLGSGAEGDVYLAHTTNGEAVALKVLASSVVSSCGAIPQEGKGRSPPRWFKKQSRALSSVLPRTQSIYSEKSEEVSIMSELSETNNSNIVQFHGIVPHERVSNEEQHHAAYAMEYVEGSTLAELLDACTIESLPWSTRTEYLLQIADGMQLLHSKQHRIQHRDLKAENVLISKDGVSAKLADFGSARRYAPHHRVKDACAMIFPQAREDAQSKQLLVGTTAYMAPETLAGKRRFGVDPEAEDVYAFGVLVWLLAHKNSGVELGSMRAAWENRPKEYFERAYLNMFGGGSRSHRFAQVVCFKEIEGYRLAAAKHIPRSLQTLIQECTAENARDRPSFDEIVEQLQNASKEFQA
eukprot:CAMPEP_0185844806 /NCGR_PEP_ID=MMETSP1354-20130828/909_1 /TAXON_ID=708628 /ORGANISM="Erythrolobus madagascarensis, Strain CCMP3276" /LENGTH=377 /DNA_ID=CAMNT_0028544583 /DNA_START=250 /DNA_END=1383 /DNA_ORIENTATION=-